MFKTALGALDMLVECARLWQNHNEHLPIDSALYISAECFAKAIAQFHRIPLDSKSVLDAAIEINFDNLVTSAPLISKYQWRDILFHVTSLNPPMSREAVLEVARALVE